MISLTIILLRDIISRKTLGGSMDSNGHRGRLRKKYRDNGLEALLEYERVELLLTYVISRRDVKGIAKELIKRYKNLDGIIKATDLDDIEGLGEGANYFFRLVGDVAKEIFRQEYTGKEVTTISGTRELIRYLRNDIGSSQVEEFKVIFLDTGNHLIVDESLSRGTIDRSAIYIRELVERVIKNRAKSIIVAHNHPSGSLKPSKADIEITLKLKQVLEALEIRLLDHIIITEGSYYSMLEEGILD